MGRRDANNTLGARLRMRIGVVGRGMESRLCDERTTDRRENSVETSREPHPCGRDDDGCQADDKCVRGMLVS